MAKSSQAAKVYFRDHRFQAYTFVLLISLILIVLLIILVRWIMAKIEQRKHKEPTLPTRGVPVLRMSPSPLPAGPFNASITPPRPLM